MSVEMICGRATGVRRVGDGEAALLLHCSLAHSGAWSGVMAAINGLEMVAVDLPGHGRTAFDPSIEVQAQAVETAVALLEGFGRPAHLIGHSFGATVALRIAVERPDLVASLSLYEPVYFSLLPLGDPAAHTAEVEASRGVTDNVASKDWVAAASAFMARWGAGQKFTDLPKPQQDFTILALPFMLNLDNPIVDPVAGGKMFAALPDIKVPCLLMEGGQSPQVINDINSVLATHMPNTRRVTFLAAGHMGPITHPREVAGAILAFIFH